jgi:predicted secreted protein
MAQPITARPGKMRILLGDGEDPETFDAPCGLTTKGLTITQNLSEVNIPDCDDPDAPFWVGRDTTSLSVSISGEGVLAAESEADWVAAAYSTDSINAKVEIEFSTGTRTFLGAFKVDSFGISATQGERVSASISMQSDGEIATSFA